MLEPIEKEKAKIWNERFEKKMKDMGLSQYQFIDRYRERFKKGRQPDVSKWMHVGEVDSKTRKERGFPAFETMRNIAEILEVSVGYLIGETDFETFEMEQASKYMGLSPNAIEATRALTSGKAILPFHKYPDPQRTAALELMLTNPFLVEYLKNVCELAEAINREQNPKNLFEKAANTIPESYRDSAIALWADSEEAVANGVNPTEELWAFVRILDDAACDDMYQPDMADREIKSAKYALHETHTKMVDELISADNLQKLLPHFATREELEQMIGVSTGQNK